MSKTRIAGLIVAGMAGLVLLVAMARAMTGPRSGKEKQRAITPLLDVTEQEMVRPFIGGPASAMEGRHAEKDRSSSVIPVVVSGTEEVGAPKSKAAGGLTASLPGLPLEAMAASQKLIRTGQLSLEVEVFDKAFGRLQQMVAEQGGYIADIRANRQEKGRAQGTVVVRVPPSRYFATLDALRGIGKVESEAVQTQDVTKAFADLEGRLRVKREMESRMREILKSSARTVQDLINTERQLFALLEEIEAMEGEKRYLAQATSLSTITLDIHEPAFVPKAEPKKSRLAESLAEAFQRSAAALIDTFSAILYLIALSLPWALVAAVGWVFGKRLLRRGPKPSES